MFKLAGLIQSRKDFVCDCILNEKKKTKPEFSYFEYLILFFHCQFTMHV